MKWLLIQTAAKELGMTKNALQGRASRGTWPRVVGAQGWFFYAVPEKGEMIGDAVSPSREDMGYTKVATPASSPKPPKGVTPKGVTPKEVTPKEADPFVDISDFPEEPSVEVKSDRESMTINAKGQGLVKNLDDLIRVGEIDLSEWRVVDWTEKTWGVPMKVATRNIDGQITGEDPVIVRTWHVYAKFERRLDSTVKPVEAATTLVRRTRSEARPGSMALIIPDTQHGFRWSENRRKLIPLHERKAIDVSIQLAEMLDCDEIILLGDMLDLAPWSVKYPRTNDLRDTTQPSLMELYHDLRRYRDACPHARMRYIEGNHEDRIRRALIKDLGEAMTLQAVGDDLPVMSLPRLLNLESIDCEYVGPYGEDFYLWENTPDPIRFQHGTKVRNKGGATAQAVVAEASYSTVFGHIHRFEVACRTVHGPNGSRTLTAGSPGCMCRTDGAVPGVTARPDWQHGVAVAYSDGERSHLQFIPILQGRLVWNGVVLQGEDRGPEYAEAIGWPVDG